jgi:hypothetical protein
MKRLIPLALIALALAAVPAAFADGGSTPPAPAGQATGPAGNPAQRFQILRLRLELAGLRFARHCRGDAANVPQACLDFAQKVEQRLQKLDSNIQARIAKIQQTCGASSTTSTTTTTASPPTKDPCANADKRIARLQQIDARVKALAQKVQGWIDGAGGSAGSSSSGTGDSTLGQAATGLNQLVQQAGATG